MSAIDLNGGTPDAWASYDPIGERYEFHGTEHDARAALDGIVDALRSRSREEGGWDDNAEQAAVCALHRVASLELRTVATAGDGTEEGEECDRLGWSHTAEGVVVDEPPRFASATEVDRLRLALASVPEQTIRAILPAGWWLRDTVAGWTVGRTVEGVDIVTSRGRTPVEAALNASAFSQAAWQEHRQYEAQLGDVNGLLDAAGYPRGAEGVRAMADDLGRCRREAREAAERAEEALATVAARLGAQ